MLLIFRDSGSPAAAQYGHAMRFALETKNLTLVLPPLDAAERMLTYHLRNREHLGPWEATRPHDFLSRPYWAKRVQELHAEARRAISYRWVLLSKSELDGPILGTCSLTQIVRGPNQSALLGYGLDKDQVGRGLMSEAVRAVLSFAFGELGLKRVMANYMPANERSAKLLRGLGFVVEGYAREYVFVDGAWQDHVLSSAINPDPAKVSVPETALPTE